MERYVIIIRPNEETVLLHCYLGDSLEPEGTAGDRRRPY